MAGIFTAASATGLIAVTAPASATPPVGTCTKSYAPYTFAELAAIDPALTTTLFSAVDANGNGIICFKPYPNGDHHGHLGNLTDDRARSHT